MAGGTFSAAVEAEADPFGEVLPCRFRLGTRMIEVAEVLDRWPGADHLYVKLQGCDGATYILRQDLHRGDWALVLFEAARAADATAAQP
jgi:hypothetical protein